VDVIVVDACGIREKGQPRVLVLEFGAGGFEGGKRSLIFAVGGIELASFFM